MLGKYNQIRENLTAGFQTLTGASKHFLVNRNDPKLYKTITVPTSPLQPGQILIRINQLGLTSNNITYASLGSSYPYMNFFPAPDSSLIDEWAQLPAWGMGVVEQIQDQNSNLKVGDSIYGLFPASTHCTLNPTRKTETGFYVDRPAIPADFAFYNGYSVVGKDPFLGVTSDEFTVILRPLFLTGLLLADRLKFDNFMQGDKVVISSASSKTAYGLAKALAIDKACKIVGLTSQANLSYSQSLGVYDEVITYDRFSSIQSDAGVCYIDIAGNTEVRKAIAKHLGEGLKLILSVGMTHGNDHATYALPEGFQGKSELFFAPGWSTKRQRDLGPLPWFKVLLNGWKSQVQGLDQHFKIIQKDGLEGLTDAYSCFLTGSSRPDTCYVISNQKLELAHKGDAVERHESSSSHAITGTLQLKKPTTSKY